MNIKKGLLLAAISVAVIGAGVIITKLNSDSVTDQNPGDTAVSPTPLVVFPPTATPSPSRAPQAVQSPSYKGDPIANIGKDPFINTLPKQIVEREKKYLAQMSESLGENPIDYNGWIGVGTSKKLFKNYKGSIDAWEYAKLISPTHPLSYLNLADLYGYYLKDLENILN